MTEFSNANDGATNTTVNYDYIASRLYRIRYADNNKESLGYYSSGYLKFKRDRRDTVIDYKYDDRWRLTKKRYFNGWSNYPNSPADSVVFWRDSLGKVDSLLLLLRENVNKLPRQNVKFEYSWIFLFFK